MKCRYCAREVEDGFSFCCWCGANNGKKPIELTNEKQRHFWNDIHSFLYNYATKVNFCEVLPSFLEEHREDYEDSGRMVRDFSRAVKLCEEIQAYKNSPTFMNPGGGFPDIHNNNKDMRELYKIFLDYNCDFYYPDEDLSLSDSVYSGLRSVYDYFNEKVIAYEDILTQYRNKLNEIASGEYDTATILKFRNNTTYTYVVQVMAKKTIPGGWFSKPTRTLGGGQYRVSPNEEFVVDASLPKPNEPFEVYWCITEIEKKKRLSNDTENAFEINYTPKYDNMYVELYADLNPSGIPDYLMRAFDWLEISRWKEANEKFDEFIYIFPDMPYPYFGKALCDLRINSLEEIASRARDLQSNEYFIEASKRGGSPIPRTINQLQFFAKRRKMNNDFSGWREYHKEDERKLAISQSISRVNLYSPR